MKILMVTMGLDIGGAETHIVELCKELRRQGHDIAVCANDGAYVPELKAAGVRHYDAPLHRRHFGTMRTARKILKQVIQQECPDIVHAHARIPAFLCGSLQRTMHFRFVTTAHWVFDTSGILRCITNWGDRTIAVSQDIKQYLIDEYSIPAAQISTTINGIDTDKFSPNQDAQAILDEFQLDASHPILTYVSRIDLDRALVARQLIELAPALCAEIPNLQLLIAGGGNVFDALNALASEQNAQIGRRCIVMTGARTDINKIVAAGDVFVGVSRAALEAMAGEKPVIVAGNEGYHGIFTADKLDEAMLGNFCCRGLPLSTPEQLKADVVALYHSDDVARATLGKFGRDVIFQHYSVGRMAQDCLDMYHRATHTPKRILMSGYYGFSNAGDDAILQAISQELSTEDALEITVLSDNPAQTQADYGLNAIPRFRLPAVLSALRRCDMLLSGGGSLLQDRTSTRSLLYYLSLILGAKFLKKPVMLYANGIGPVQRKGNRRLVRHTVEMADIVTLRDQNSLQELREIGVTRDDLLVTADPVFHLAPAPKSVAQTLLAQAGLPVGKPFVAVSIRSWMNIGDFPTQLALLCDHLHRTHGLEILFVLMQPSHDLAISQSVIAQMTCPAHLMEDEASPSRIMAVLGEAELCLAMRLHTLIFAAHMGVPTVGIDYDPKVASFLQELNLPSAGKVDAFNGQTSIAVTDALIHSIDDYRRQLAQTAQQLSQSADENQRILLDFLTKIHTESSD